MIKLSARGRYRDMYLLRGFELSLSQDTSRWAAPDDRGSQYVPNAELEHEGNGNVPENGWVRNWDTF